MNVIEQNNLSYTIYFGWSAQDCRFCFKAELCFDSSKTIIFLLQVKVLQVGQEPNSGEKKKIFACFFPKPGKL